jgi:hypothetical protein
MLEKWYPLVIQSVMNSVLLLISGVNEMDANCLFLCALLGKLTHLGYTQNATIALRKERYWKSNALLA